MPYSADYWAEVEAIFTEAIDLDPAGRQRFLDGRTAGKPQVRAEVESLLAAHERAERPTGTTSPPGRTASIPATGADPRIAAGMTVGPYRLVEAIGAGGMGTVYRAARISADFDHQVAIKLIDAPLDRAGAARRFRAERQILASLRHPHIVHLIDGAVTETGLAYLVMEYVDGRPISEYCRDRRLPLAARLRLFRQVCAAVHHAHRHFVVHRDLKPANILVTPDGVPKVLDFGVAKLLEQPDLAGAAVTLPGGGPMTPNYASPEQLRGLPVTTSSDVYALGVLLYELVTGARPYETSGKPLDEVLRLVLDGDPARPSANLTAAETLPYDPRRALRGDIDAIVSCAMRKEPERRYASADELGEDVERFLAGEPVQAREPSLGYVVRKLAAAHKGVFVSAAVSLVLILAALILATWQARIATAERRRSERRFNEVRELANTLIFKIHDEVAPLAGSTPVRQAIVAEALRYLERLAPDAGGDEALLSELARAYIKIGRVQGAVGAANLGDREGAVASFRKARAIMAPLATRPGASISAAVDYTQSLFRLTETLHVIPGSREEGRQIAREALAFAAGLQRRHPDDERVRLMVANAAFMLAIVADLTESLQHWLLAHELFSAHLAARPDDRERQRNVALVEKYLGTYYFNTGDLARALAHHERARVLDERRLASQPGDRQSETDLAFDLGNLAQVFTRRGELARAADLYERSLAIRKSLAAGDPGDHRAQSRVAYAHSQLARIYQASGDLPRAYAHVRAAAAIQQSGQARDIIAKQDLGQTLATLGAIASARGYRTEACRAYERAFDILRTLDVADRGDGLFLKNDPVPDVAARAASCGVERAGAWLRTGPPPVSARR